MNLRQGGVGWGLVCQIIPIPAFWESRMFNVNIFIQFSYQYGQGSLTIREVGARVMSLKNKIEHFYGKIEDFKFLIQ